MGRLAFVFSGQGDQYPGMGLDLYEQEPEAKELFHRFDGIRQGTSSQCFYGTEEELKETRNTQPCLFAMELSAASVLLNKGYRPEAAAGFSLGEVAAAAFSGLFDYETGFRLVCRRGELMQQEAEKYDTSMAAVLKLSEEQVQNLCRNYSHIYPVNYNCPGQITVSGLNSQMGAFSEDVKKAGGRALPLKVKGAFHSPFMEDAAKAFRMEVQKAVSSSAANRDHLAPAEQGITLYSNKTAEPYTEDIAGLLSDQICSPVQWEKLIRNMISQGIDTFVEIGPGSTLTNMIKKISRDVKAVAYSDCLKEEKPC